MINVLHPSKFHENQWAVKSSCHTHWQWAEHQGTSVAYRYQGTLHCMKEVVTLYIVRSVVLGMREICSLSTSSAIAVE